MISRPLPVHPTLQPRKRQLQHPAMPAQHINQRKYFEDRDLQKRMLVEQKQLRLTERAHDIRQELHHLGALSNQGLPGTNAAHVLGLRQQLQDVRRHLREMK